MVSAARTGVLAAQEKEVGTLVVQVGEAPLVDAVGVHDDGAPGGLAEDFGEADHGDPAAADEVGEEIARPHAGQLVRVAHQHQAAVPPQGGEQGPHEGDIHHGRLVHNDRVHRRGSLSLWAKTSRPVPGSNWVSSRR